MLTNKSRPVIGKLIIGSGYRTGVVTSPRSPLDMKNLSPAGRKNIDAGGIGLGILAALEKSGETEKTLCCRNLTRSDPIPVGSNNSGRIKGGLEETDTSSSEEYTYVTCHRPENKSFTRVYGGAGAGAVDSRRKGQRRGGSEAPCVFDKSPAKLQGPTEPTPANYPTLDFLSSCNLCYKDLDGKDIYMYRGEKAFCSPECRCMQIAMDERVSSTTSSSTSRSVSNSPNYANDQIFFSTGILAI